MKATKNITIDLNRPARNVVHLGQGDNQRQIILTLLKDGVPFDVSEGIGTATLVAGVHYIKANGVGGYYDWTSTDVAAVVLATGTTNVWNVLIDEHATDVPGFAEIFVTFSLGSGETLHSFPITLDVGRVTSEGTDPDRPYYHSTSFLLAGAQDAKTPAMSFPVGVDGDGKLWAEGGWSAEAKEALIACFEQVAWKTPYGQTYLSALETALNPEVHLVSITADYQQDRAIYDTDPLDVIKTSDDLTVTAHYSDGTSEVLADEDYTLSGTLDAPSSIITVEYGGKTAEIEVLVTPFALYEFPDLKTETTKFILETTKRGHVKLTVISNISYSGASGIAVNIYGRTVGALNDPTAGIKNQPKTFTIPANVATEFAIKNIVNLSGNSLSINLYKANAESSMGADYFLSTTTTDTSKSTTLGTAADIFTPFIYITVTNNTLPAGYELECDLSLTVGNDRYF